MIDLGVADFNVGHTNDISQDLKAFENRLREEEIDQMLIASAVEEVRKQATFLVNTLRHYMTVKADSNLTFPDFIVFVKVTLIA